MSVYSSSVVVSEMTVINAAVQHLTDLGFRMKTGVIAFKPDDVNSIDEVITALHDLELERLLVHDDLEVETINSSILRKQLLDLPEKIRFEIEGAVAAARQSNVAELKQLENDLKVIDENIQYLEIRHKELEETNALLHPKRDKLRKQHEALILQLNQRMAEKASKQIFLNETRDKLRTTNQKIVDLEDGILQLKEDLVQERADVRLEKRQLKKTVYDTSLKSREQHAINKEKRLDVDNLHQQLSESINKLISIRKIITQYEASKSRLIAQEKGIVLQIETEKKNNEIVHKIGQHLGEATISENQEWQQEKAILDVNISGVENKLAFESKRNKVVSSTHHSLSRDITKVKARNREDENKIKEINKELQKLKTQIADKAGIAGEISEDSVTMGTEYEELRLAHQATMRLMKKQIEEAHAMFAKERKASVSLQRVTVQEKHEDVSTSISEINSTRKVFVVESNNRIQNGKNQHEKLATEARSLQQNIKQDSHQIKKLRAALSRESLSYTSDASKYDTEVLELTKLNAEAAQELRDIKQTIEENQPNYKLLERQVNELNNKYNFLKRDIVAKKNRKCCLEDQIVRVINEMKKIEISSVPQNEENEKVRAKTMEQLKSQNAEVEDMERKMYVLGCTLKTVLEENEPFTNANMKMEDEIEYMMAERQKHLDNINALTEQENDERSFLDNCLKDDYEMEKTFAQKDNEIIESLSDLLERTGDRNTLITTVTKKLHSELSVLGNFLRKVSTKTSKDTDQQKEDVGVTKDPSKEDIGGTKNPSGRYPVIPPINANTSLSAPRLLSRSKQAFNVRH